MDTQRTTSSSSSLSRRDLLKTVLYTSPVLLFDRGGLFADQPVKPLTPPRLINPGRKIRVAQVGVFNRGGGVLKAFARYEANQIQFKAFSDVAFNLRNPRHRNYPQVPCFVDYREMLEKMHQEIDAVIVCTPDHAHFPVVMHAMLLGKHVYVEKPLANNVYECRLLDRVARECGVVTQMGNQGHSGSGTFQFAAWEKAGLIKNVKRIDAWMANSRRWHGWTYKDYPEVTPPAGYDWDQWLCRRPFRPHSPQLTGGNWRCWYEFGCGAMGDWGAHILDAIHRYLKCGQPYEIHTELKGPSDLIYPQGSVITFRFKARSGMPPLELKWYDGRGNVPQAPGYYPADKMGGVGSLIYTQDYVIRGRSHGANYEIITPGKYDALKKARKLPSVKGDLSNHYKNFLNACQGLEPANSSFDVSAPLSELLCLGCIGQRFGGTLKYDPRAMKITNHAKANAMLKGPAVREGWRDYDRGRVVASKAARIKKPSDVTWEPLFKNTRLSNWENPYTYGEAKMVGNEVHLSSTKGKWFLLTKQEYTNFVFEGQIKMPVNKGNSGFLFRCLKKKNRAWGYQAEVDTSERMWSGGLYDEGRRKWFISPNRDQASSDVEKNRSIADFRKRAGECFKQGAWNTYRIVCIGTHIQIYVNGVLTTDIHDDVDLEGPIGIQHHGEKGLVYKFRNLRIKDLGAGGDVFYPHRDVPARKEDANATASRLEGDVYEAEAAELQGCTVATNHAGYQGKGFVDFGNAGSSLVWDNILSDSNGQATLTFRYAAIRPRPCDLYINGRKVGKVQFKNTKTWTQWKTENIKVTFRKGGNAVKLVAIGEGPNLDAVAVN